MFTFYTIDLNSRLDILQWFFLPVRLGGSYTILQVVLSDRHVMKTVLYAFKR